MAEAPNRFLNAWRHISVRGGAVTVLPTVKRNYGKIDGQPQAVYAERVYQHAARNGVDPGELLVTWQPAGRRDTAWRPLIHLIAKIQAEGTLTCAAPPADLHNNRCSTVANVEQIRL